MMFQRAQRASGPGTPALFKGVCTALCGWCTQLGTAGWLGKYRGTERRVSVEAVEQRGDRGQRSIHDT